MHRTNSPFSQRSRSKRAAVLAERAREMRALPTWGEARLWHELRGSRLGVAFRRQLVIGRYIADFAAPSVRLVVEVDGGYHAACAVRDARRDRALARAGYRVLRLEDELVQRRMPEAVTGIRAAVDTLR